MDSRFLFYLKVSSSPHQSGWRATFSIINANRRQVVGTCQSPCKHVLVGHGVRSTNKGVFLSRRGRAASRRRPRPAADRYRLLEISAYAPASPAICLPRRLGLRVYITPPPATPADTPPQITAYKANFIGTCMQYAQGATPNCAWTAARPDCFDILAGSVNRLLHVES